MLIALFMRCKERRFGVPQSLPWDNYSVWLQFSLNLGQLGIVDVILNVFYWNMFCWLIFDRYLWNCNQTNDWFVNTGSGDDWVPSGNKLLPDPKLAKIFATTRCHWCVNRLMPRKDGRHFPDDIFKCIFLNENVELLINISLQFIPKGVNNNIRSLLQIMAWRRSGG